MCIKLNLHLHQNNGVQVSSCFVCGWNHFMFQWSSLVFIDENRISFHASNVYLRAKYWSGERQLLQRVFAQEHRHILQCVYLRRKQRHILSPVDCTRNTGTLYSIFVFPANPSEFYSVFVCPRNNEFVWLPPKQRYIIHCVGLPSHETEIHSTLCLFVFQPMK